MIACSLVSRRFVRSILVAAGPMYWCVEPVAFCWFKQDVEDDEETDDEDENEADIDV